MKKLILILLLIPFIAAAQAGSEVKKATKQVKNIEKVLDDDEHGGGKPAVPGAKGRANAEIKKATNPGQGGGKDGSLGGAMLDELDDDEEHGKKDKKDGKGAKDKKGGNSQ